MEALLKNGLRVPLPGARGHCLILTCLTDDRFLTPATNFFSQPYIYVINCVQLFRNHFFQFLALSLVVSSRERLFLDYLVSRGSSSCITYQGREGGSHFYHCKVEPWHGTREWSRPYPNIPISVSSG